MFRRLYRQMTNRFKDYVRQTVADSVAEVFPADAGAVWEASLRKAVSRLDLAPVVDQVLDRVKTGQAVEYDRLAECIDPEELAKQFDTADLAGEMDYSSLAGEIDMSLLAREFDTADIAGEISISSLAEEFDEDELAEKVVESLDYKSLARALLAEIKAEPVTVRPSA